MEECPPVLQQTISKEEEGCSREETLVMTLLRHCHDTHLLRRRLSFEVSMQKQWKGIADCFYCHHE
jgi:hypothetical protein